MIVELKHISSESRSGHKSGFEFDLREVPFFRVHEPTGVYPLDKADTALRQAFCKFVTALMWAQVHERCELWPEWIEIKDDGIRIYAYECGPVKNIEKLAEIMTTAIEAAYVLLGIATPVDDLSEG